MPPAGMSRYVAAVRTPSRRGSSPSTQRTSAPPCGTYRCATGASPTYWIQTDDATAASAGAGARSRYVDPVLTPASWR
ncbi:hypothetical protein GCM10023203_49750 [Actinomycetospora straminea]|uniref:Uncharacterized protein n=1 Tax=Actinomycetospora straminea TaxID=663607 RepID=A0ABP9F004_9PSEU